MRAGMQNSGEHVWIRGEDDREQGKAWASSQEVPGHGDVHLDLGVIFHGILEIEM